MKEKQPGVLSRIAGALPVRRGVAIVSWQPMGRIYPRLIGFDPRELSGRSGLYLLWHLGVRPQWLRAGFSADLAAAAALLAGTPEIVTFESHNGPFLSWNYGPPENAAGLVNFLANRLNPVLQNLALACDMPIDRKAAAIGCALPLGTKDVHRALNTHADRN